MNKRDADRVRIAFYDMQQNYEALARELHRMLDLDARFPSESVYTVKHRLKDDGRLIEKIDEANRTRLKRKIDHTNFQNFVHDLLGVRVVCLRLSDLDKLKDYLQGLLEESRLIFLEGPIEKKTFLVHPGEVEPQGKGKQKQDIQYSGYSSIHYVVSLGKSVNAGRELSRLKAELQLRTILEEAWGEIDHKYRYELKRVGLAVPSHVESGFRDLGLYLQAAARQAEHLCEETGALVLARTRSRKTKSRAAPKRRVNDKEVSSSKEEVTRPTTVAEVFKSRIGFIPSDQTLRYCERRMSEHAHINATQFDAPELYAALNTEILGRFNDIYKNTVGSIPFSSAKESEVGSDVVALMNFVIFSTVESPASAAAGLKSVLERRKFW